MKQRNNEKDEEKTRVKKISTIISSFCMCEKLVPSFYLIHPLQESNSQEEETEKIKGRFGKRGWKWRRLTYIHLYSSCIILKKKKRKRWDRKRKELKLKTTIAVKIFCSFHSVFYFSLYSSVLPQAWSFPSILSAHAEKKNKGRKVSQRYIKVKGRRLQQTSDIRNVCRYCKTFLSHISSISKR